MDHADMPPYLFRTKPLIVPKIWGGTRLIAQFGKEGESQHADQPIGESWEVADLPEGQSLVDSGPLAGATLHEAVRRWGAALVGQGRGRFPLLVKLLDAAHDLSVQVHPGPEHLEDLPGDARSKDECWIILDVEPRGSILHGMVSPTPSLEQVERALRSDADPTPWMRRAPVTRGDVVRVQPGTLHAIGAGVSLLEIQQPSDTTYRVFDYNRPGMDGKPRELHVDRALAVANFGDQPNVFTRPMPDDKDARVEHLVRAPDRYCVRRLRASERGDPIRVDACANSPLVLVNVEGRCQLSGPGGQRLVLEPYTSAIVPAALPWVELWALGRAPCELLVANV